MANDVRLIDANALIANEDLLIIIGAGDNICIDIADIAKAPTVDAVEIGSCEGCHWKAIGRHHKCSCCRRNRYLKDCYLMEVNHE